VSSFPWIPLKTRKNKWETTGPQEAGKVELATGRTGTKRLFFKAGTHRQEAGMTFVRTGEHWGERFYDARKGRAF